MKRKIQGASLVKSSKELSESNLQDFIKTVEKNRELSFVQFNGEYHFSDAENDFIVNDNTYIHHVFNKLKPIIENAKIKKVLFDSKRERKMLLNYNINLSSNVFDCMIAKHLCSGEKITELEQLTDDYEFLRVNPALCLISSGVVLIENLERYNMQKLYFELELPLSIVLFNMEQRGFKIDIKRVEELKEKYNLEIERLTKEIHDLVGKEFNINSPKQLGEIIYDELKLARSKKKSTAVESLEKHPLIPLIIRYRKVSKLLNTAILGTVNYMDKSGYVHTTFNQTLTTTGRLSSSEPNLQNIPIRDEENREIRSMFVASSDSNVLIDADYSQIELRILAHLSGDEKLIDSFNNGQDIHTETACQIFNVAPELVTGEMRRLAKVVNFGINYGMSDFGLARDLNISVSEAKKYIDTYYLNHPKVKAYMEKSINDAKETGRVTTLLGRTRKMVDINSSNYMVRQGAERASQNMPVQGSASDIIKIAMLNIENKLAIGGYKARLIMQVHDELVFEVPKEELEQLKSIILDCMALKDQNLKIPLDVDINYGLSWKEG